MATDVPYDRPAEAKPLRATPRRIGIIATACLALAVAGCGSNGDQQPQRLPQGSEPSRLDPANFTTEIDNPYWPMAPGSRWVYREAEGGSKKRVVVTVTNDTKRVDGVTARVIHDVVSENGRVVEDTYDWYAQDKAGNVWYLGENTKEYKDGEIVSTAGSWEAGVDGAQAGVIVPAKPRVGMSYRQEYYAGEAEDAARVLSVDERVEVPFGSYRGVVMTKDFTPLDPEILEYKFYARGVGPVLTLAISGGSGREDLVDFHRWS